MAQASSHKAASHKAAPPARLPVDEALWARLVDAGDGREFAGAWLGLQCAMIEGVGAGLVLLEDQTGQSFAPMAVWPDATIDFTRLKDVAEEAANGARGAVRREREAPGAPVRVAYPIIIEEHVSGLVVIELSGVDDAAVQDALRRLHWGIGWLEARILLRRGEEQRAKLARAAIALDILSIAGEEQALQAAAMSVANELALRFACERAALGLVSDTGGQSARIRLVAISNTAWFKPGAPLAASFENLMEEAVDQAATVAVPPVESIAPTIAVAHRAHREGEGASGLLTVVLSHRGAPVGAVTLERRDAVAFSRDDALTAEAVGEMLGPLFDLKYQQRRLLAGRIPEAVGDGVRAVFGPRRPSLKLGLIAGLIALLVVLFFPVAFRVSARAVLEGAQQRAAAAPFQGFVAVANHRAGAVVKRGDVLAEFDDKDLRLDVARWRSEYARLLQANRKALAAMDRAEVALVDAQMEQARAQLELANVKLERAKVTAPIDGVIVSGDWSQKLGAPVDQGTVLFEISPLESFRVTLKIDEADIGYVREGQQGTLLLAGRADASLPLTVTRVTSVAAVEDGQNVFRAEASLPAEAQAIRPGMEGVAKIDVGSAGIGWVWSRRFIDWLRLFSWRNTP